MALRFDRREDIRALISLVLVLLAMIWPMAEDVFKDLLSSYPDLSTIIIGTATATIGIYFGVRQASETLSPPPLGLPEKAIRGLLLLFLVIGLSIGILIPDYMNWGFLAGFIAAVIGWAYGK
ncbi:MAG: hypothetical protein ACFFB2_19670 [Promethearchaeota archaeon]